MEQLEIKKAFAELGVFLGQFNAEKNTENPAAKNNTLFFSAFEDLIELSVSHNGWFTKSEVCFAVQSWAKALTENNLNQWLTPYNFNYSETKNVGMILAGNIPLVGFHDFLSVLISGHNALIKTSSNDQHLIKFLANYLIALDERFNKKITFVEGKLENFDAVIATGSNNTARYFEHYFKNKPNIIRKNRNSVAILTGNETKDELEALGEDIFRYFGLGCRNVSKLFFPRDYDFKLFFEAIYKFKDVVFYEKYANNYDYNKAVFLMSLFKLLDNEFLTLKEDEGYASPISSVFYERYDELNSVLERLEKDQDKIQCVVSKNLTQNSISFGETQKPNLWDYADNVDTLTFLSKI